MIKVILFTISFFIFSLARNIAQTKYCQNLKNLGSKATPIYYSPENLRSDTIDILKYIINLDITDFVNKKITGNTIIRFAPKINFQNKLRLDLLKLQIDSIKQKSSILTYSYNDTILKINLV